MTLVDEREIEDADGDAERQQPAGRGLRVVLAAVSAIALVIALVGAGWLMRGTDQSASDGPSAVDIGFAQDMATHHTQAVTMAGIERDGTTDAKLRVLAFDIETSQQFQVGQMQGWLDTWGKSRNSDEPMSWMGHDHMAMGANGLMPGMATQPELDRLVRVKGKALDILFLQLMIRHHQGGLPMAQYAYAHARTAYVRNLAQVMVSTQSSEIVYMEQLLRGMGGSPLPPPT